MELSTLQLGLIPVIVGVVEVVKSVGLSAKYASLVSLALGIVTVGVMDSFTATSIIAGLVVGLSASGLYSGTRAVTGI